MVWKIIIYILFLYFHIWEVLPHSRECRSPAAFPGGSMMIQEGSYVCYSLYSWAGQFESYLVENPWREVFACRGSFNSPAEVLD